MPIDTDILRISKEAQKILDITGAVYQENGIALPTRQYLAVGDPGKTAHDDEQVTVSFGAVSDGMPYNSVPILQRCNEPYHGNFTLEIVRCTPAPRKASGGLSEVAPTAVSLNDYAVTRMTDAWLLVEIANRVMETTWAEKAGYNVTFGDDSGAMQAAIMTINMVV